MRIVFRTEGNHRQGMGDVWGSLAIAEMCAASGAQVGFMCSGGEAVDAVRQAGYACDVVSSAQEEQTAVAQRKPDVIVVNQLQTSPECIRAFKAHARLVVTIDDAGPGAAVADLRINVLYDAPDAITDLRYVMLRRDVAAFHARAKPVPQEIHELLVTQGGADTHGFTPRIVDAIGQLRIPHCTVVVGPAFRHDRELEQVLRQTSAALSMVRNTRDMARLMWNADLAITAGGLTLFELACIGTPSLTICGERFELETARRLEQAGITRCLGFGGDLGVAHIREAVEWLAQDAPRRHAMSQTGKRLIDGQGAGRIVQLIQHTLVEIAGTRT